ncbi:MAG: glycosyl transferase [Firmicutes bacterium]|nr:glycosyl transferase [Bacillota bacterium]
MIPKIIHYIWFGGNQLPNEALKCIESWKKFCPDYEIIEWNESNFDVNSCKYVKEAYEAKKWAFVSDYVRLAVLVKYGGIYMDTDVEVLKPLDEFLTLKAFSGFENETDVPTGIMACEKTHSFFKKLLEEYNDINFIDSNGNYDMTTNVTRITKACVAEGLKRNNTKQTICDFTLFPKDYFCPLNAKTGLLKKTNNTHTIHWFSGSWKTVKEKQIHNKAKEIRKKYPGKFGVLFANTYEISCKITESLKEGGIELLINKTKKYIAKRKAK